MRRNPPISKIDLDMTNNCVLACDYCFRGEKNPRKLTWEVGSRAIDWLIEKSQNEKKLSVSLFGGEPLMEFKLIKELVPYAKKKAVECGKRIYFTAVTNSVLVTDEIIEFFRKYNMTFHTSIDGGPETQDAHRHTWRNRNNDHKLGASHLVRHAWENMLRDEGLQYNFISYVDVIQNGIPKEYKVLILPATLCLSDVEGRRIKNF